MLFNNQFFKSNPNLISELYYINSGDQISAIDSS